MKYGDFGFDDHRHCCGRPNRGCDQAVDPLIASAEGLANCPAYRGIAYAVFEDMDLSSFGNRIPSLSFEVIGGGDALRLSDVLVDALDGPSMAAVSPAIEGAVQLGATRRDSANALLRLIGVQRDAATGAWAVGESEAVVTAIGSAASTDANERERVHYAATLKRPVQIALGCYDPSRDFQSTVQVARVAGGDGAIERIDLAIAASAGAAKAIVSTLAGAAAQASVVRERPSGFAALGVSMGARVLVDESTARMIERKIEGAQIYLKLDETPLLIWHDAGNGDGGRSISAPDLTIGSSVGHLLDLPAWGEGASGLSGGLAIAVAGTGAGWRSAVVEVSASATAPPTVIGPAIATPVLGTVAAVASAAQSTLIDTVGWIDVDLLRGDMALTNASDADLLAGTNLAMAGGELFQFGHAEPLGSGRWRLSRLLRGRIGTEGAMTVTASGQDFTLIDAASLLSIPSVVGLNGVGAGGVVTVSGQGDSTALALPIPSGGRALRPLCPVHLRHAWADDGALTLSWIRRSRIGFVWRDGVDAPLDERMERYRIGVAAGAIASEFAADAPGTTFSPAQIALWRAAAATITINIRQAGESAESLPLTTTIAI